jgi:glycosyltransferase involved in cell wall biosynthesis
MTTLSVVIPAYNEENGIAEIVDRVLKIQPALAAVGVDHLELIVVNDASKDRTADVVRGIPGVRLINHPVNKGYGGALKTGFSNAQGELVGFLDADGTYPPEYFPQLCQVALKDAELVIGSRLAGEKSQMPLIRRVGNIFFAGLLTIVSRQKVTDSASGMRVFRRDVISRIFPLPDGLNLTPVMSTRAIHEGVTIAEVPIPYSVRVGRSKLSVVKDGTIFLQSIIWTALTYNPVRILGMMGLAGMAIAFVIAAHFILGRLQGITTIQNWQVVNLCIGMVAGVTGLNIFILGVAFNYLVSLFVKRPVRHGLFGRMLFKQPLDQQFGWIGALAVVIGLVVGVTTIILGVQSWSIVSLWLYLLSSSMLILLGVQLIIYWAILRVLDELGQRELLTQKDLGSTETGEYTNSSPGSVS